MHTDAIADDAQCSVIDCGFFSLLAPGWSANEELALLDAIEQCGFDNWTDVAGHMGTKGAEECRVHYYRCYLGSATAPLPDPARPLMSARAAGGSARSSNGAGGASATSDGALAALNRKTIRALEEAGENVSIKVYPATCASYMPLRDDFEVEWQNGAEALVRDLAFADNDSEPERRLKCAVLDMYLSYVERRHEMKDVIREHHLADLCASGKLSAGPRSTGGTAAGNAPAGAAAETPDAFAVRDEWRKFARFHSSDSHERLVQGLLQEQRLRNRIKQLQEYRANGIRSCAAGAQYELAKRQVRVRAGGVLVAETVRVA